MKATTIVETERLSKRYGSGVLAYLDRFPGSGPGIDPQTLPAHSSVVTGPFSRRAARSATLGVIRPFMRESGVSAHSGNALMIADPADPQPTPR